MSIIEIEDLVYYYPDATLALDGVNFQAEKSESVALLGANGAGKSTLLLHINGLLRGHSGTVKVLGRMVEDKNLRWLRRRVGIVFQDPDDQLFMPTLAEDVAFGPANMCLSEDQVNERVNWALQSVGLVDLKEKASHHLSFGQKKRAALATVLSMKPEVLVLDEPTSNLDPRSKMQMVLLIRSLQDSGTTIITATHDVNLVPYLADRTVLLDKKVAAMGSTRQILGNRALMEGLGLEMPILADVFERLHEENIHSPITPMTKDEAIDVVREILKKNW
ncbi:MAG: ATP-binding cassette domain-containing protein [Methanothrix sp.]|nr:ATP-binding cassette domain-containing protein [Methanothrix sp.]